MRQYPVRSSLSRIAFLLVTWLPLLACMACDAAVSKAEFENGRTDEGQAQTSVTVFAASSLTEAFQEIARSYEAQRENTSVILNFDGSQRLRTQLEHGAQADVFASADWQQMNELTEEGLTSGNPVNFASNRLVFLLNAEFARATQSDGMPATPWPPSDTVKQIKSLSTPGTRIVLAVKEAPAGRYTEELLERIGQDPELGVQVAEGIRANVVSRETNVRSVAQKVALGEADVGITYGTDALTDYVSQRVEVVALAGPLDVTAYYPVVSLSEERAASDFIEFLLSAEGQRHLMKFGLGAAAAAVTGRP